MSTDIPEVTGGNLHYKLVMFLLVLFTGSLSASDLNREQRIALEIEDALLVGYPLRLNSGELTFFAIHNESASERFIGGAIILHGRGANPNWVDVVYPLRTELPESGWETLSIQMPVAAPDAPDERYQELIPEAFPRISAAVEFLRQRQVENIVLVGHSLGARMALEYLASEPSPDVRALVAVGLSADREKPDAGTLLALQKVKLPILDIYGSRDIEPVLSTVAERAAKARRAGNRDYRQLEVPGADHFFNGLDNELVQRIRAWLQKTIAERTVMAPAV